jgi:hypothetical protein
MPTFREKSPPCDGWYVIKWDSNHSEVVWLSNGANQTWQGGLTETEAPSIRLTPDDEWQPLKCAQCEAHSKTIDGLLAERASLTAEVAALKKQLAESEGRALIDNSAAAIGKQIATQDNACTHEPLFVVEEQRRFYGLDPEYASDDEIAWLDEDHAEADAEKRKELEAKWDENDEEPDGWTRTAYVNQWHFVTACLTKEGADEYIRTNGHNHKGKLRVYVHSLYRNAETIAVRAHLLALAKGEQ